MAPKTPQRRLTYDHAPVSTLYAITLAVAAQESLVSSIHLL
jgi:hypothetical protein